MFRLRSQLPRGGLMAVPASARPSATATSGLASAPTSGVARGRGDRRGLIIFSVGRQAVSSASTCSS